MSISRIASVLRPAAALPALAALVIAGSARGQCSPAILGSVDTPDQARVVAVSGTVAYVADDSSGLQVIDVSDPANPAILGSVDTPGLAFGVTVSGTVAYVADGSSGLQVIDVSDPANPAILGSVDTPDFARGVAVSGTVAYVADTDLGLQVIDVSDPANPAILGSVDTPGTAAGVAVSGTVAYVADRSSGLQVIDVSDPANPAILGSIDTTGNASGVAVSGTVAYVADGGTGLQVIDVSDPANPAILGSVDMQVLALGVAASGTVAYVADHSSGLQVIDVSDPANPAILGSVDTPGFALGVAVSGTVAYVADDLPGLQVIDVSTCSSDLTLETTGCADADPVEPGHQVAIELWMRNLNSEVTGFQAFLAYDDVAMTYRGDLSTYTMTPFPVHFQDIENVAVPVGEIRLDGLAMFGGAGTMDDSLLATLIFDVTGDCPTVAVTFDLTQPFDSHLSFNGDGILTNLTDAPNTTDDTPPTLDGCVNVTRPADANSDGGCDGAFVAYTTPTATDDCDSSPDVACDLASGSFFPLGITTVTCTATDNCGNEAQCTFDVEVTATNLIDVEVELFGISAPATRCVYLVTNDCDVSADVELSFIDHDGDDTDQDGLVDGTNDPATPVRAVDTIEVACGTWATLCAKDEQHTKWGTANLVVNGATYGMDPGTPVVQLRAGDTDNDGDVDINDATLFLAQYGGPEPAGGCPWDGTRGADFSNDGNVGSEDYSLMSAQWLTLSGCTCVEAATWSGETSVATSRLEPWIAKRADLNRDGVVDRTDVRIFEAIHGLDGSLSEAMRKAAMLGGR